MKSELFFLRYTIYELININGQKLMLVPAHQYFSQTEKQSEAEFRKAVPAHQYFSQTFFKRSSYSTTYKLIKNYAGVEF